MKLERIIKIIKNHMLYTICEHEEAVLEYRVCRIYFSKPSEALKCYKEKQNQPEFIKIKNKEYLLCPKAPRFL